MLEGQYPELAHWFGLTRDQVDATPWWQLITYRMRLPNLPPIGRTVLGNKPS